MGNHQARAPKSCMSAGTRTERMITASIRTAEARPRPKSLMIRSSPSMKEAKTVTMIAAAAVITRPVRARPRVTASDGVVASLSHSSWIRDIRKTS